MTLRDFAVGVFRMAMFVLAILLLSKGCRSNDRRR